MIKRKLLFVIDSLSIGGAEKSLIALLNNIDVYKYEIDLLMFKKGGDLEKLLPKNITLLDTPEYFRRTSENYKTNIVHKLFRIRTSINLRINGLRKSPFHSEQVVFGTIKTILTPLEKSYDVAIAYSQGMPTYFVAHKVNSPKKIAWINTDYKNTLYNKDLDYQSYKNFNDIVTVSENTMKSVRSTREEYKEKLDIIMDIIDPELIIKMSKEYLVNEFDKSDINLLTVGRLASVKGYDKAIRVAALLKDAGYKFKWFVVGEGPDRNQLQTQIDKWKLKDNFILLGKKLNPYVYMKNCDIYVQTSLKEGFGLTISEAKILKKPIVCTNFPTANEIIKHNQDGLIVDHEIESIFKGIERYITDTTFRNKIIKRLDSSQQYNTVNQIEQFYKKIDC